MNKRAETVLQLCTNDAAGGVRDTPIRKGDVRNLTGERLPVPAVAEELSELLAEAERGELVGFGLAALCHDGTSYHVCSGALGGLAMVGAARMMSREIEDAEEQAEERGADVQF